MNGRLLRERRRRRRWTQEELAARSGYSVRLIAKAEAGGSLHPDTIEILAATLDTPDHRLTPEDLIHDPLALARRFIRAYARHERDTVAACRSLLSPRVTAWVDGDPRQIPFAGRYESIDGLDRFFHTFFGLFYRPDKAMFAAPAMLSQGNRVVAWGHERVAFHGTPPLPRGGLVTIHMVFERGRLAQLQGFYNTASVLEYFQKWGSARRAG